MSSNKVYPDYDLFAQIYNESWGPNSSKQFLPILEKFLFPSLSPEAQVLDFCCGTGQITQQLLGKGYQVMGIDGSREMLAYASRNAPAAHFILADARCFKAPPTFHAVVSKGSLLHILQLEELTNIFNNVFGALLDQGLFVFDLTPEEYYLSVWNSSISEGDIQDDYAWANRFSYNPDEKLGNINVTIFQLNKEMNKENWQRFNLNWPAKCYDITEVQATLEKVGFAEVDVYYGQANSNEISNSNHPERAYFVARKASQ